MVINIFQIIAIFGLLSIISGTFLLSKTGKIKKQKIYSFLFFGGICLLTYSIYIKDTIFVLLQAFYILIVLYDIIKLKNSKKK